MLLDYEMFLQFDIIKEIHFKLSEMLRITNHFIEITNYSDGMNIRS